MVKKNKCECEICPVVTCADCGQEQVLLYEQEPQYCISALTEWNAQLKKEKGTNQIQKDVKKTYTKTPRKLELNEKPNYTRTT